MRKRGFWTVLGLICVVIVTSGHAQIDPRSTYPASGEVQSQDKYLTRPIQLIDLPTASILAGGDLRTGIRVYEGGSILARLSVGISNRLMFGVSFTGEHLIGGEDIKWSEMPGVHFAYRVIEEDLRLPAIVLGIDTQGYGKYWRKDDYRDPENPDVPVEVSNSDVLLDRYSFKARGFYCLVSKGYQSIRRVGLHAGVSMSTERRDSDNDPTLFMGSDIELIHDIIALVEYDFATNDDKITSANSGRGYLNMGLRWAFTRGMTIEFDLKNILSNNKAVTGRRRILKISFHGSILN